MERTNGVRDVYVLADEGLKPAGLLKVIQEDPNAGESEVLSRLGDMAGLPTFLCQYSDELRWYQVVPLNGRAKDFVPCERRLSQAEWMTLLCKLQGQEVEPEVLRLAGTLLDGLVAEGVLGNGTGR